MRLTYLLCFVLLSNCAKKQEKLIGVVPSFNDFHDIASAPQAIKQASRAVVKLSPATGSHSGTGFFVSEDGVLMTNSHVLGLQDCARQGCAIVVTSFLERSESSDLREQSEAIAKPLTISPENDFAIYQLYKFERSKSGELMMEETLSTPDFLELSSKDTDDMLAEETILVGHPYGLLKKWSSGSVIGRDDISDDWLFYDNAGAPGNSGSPVLDTEGKVLGIHHRGGESINQTDVARTGIFTSAAAVQGHSKNALLGLVQSDSLYQFGEAGRELQKDFEVSRNNLHFNASVLDVNAAESASAKALEGKAVPLTDLLWERCEQTIDTDRAMEISEAEIAFAACDALPKYILCDEANDSAIKPWRCVTSEEEKKIWSKRSQKIAAFASRYHIYAERYFEYMFPQLVLSDSWENASAAIYEAVSTDVDKKRLRLDFRTINILAMRAYDAGAFYHDRSRIAQMREILKNYQSAPDAYLKLDRVLNSFLNLAYSEEEATSFIKQIMADPKTDLYTSLYADLMLANRE